MLGIYETNIRTADSPGFEIFMGTSNLIEMENYPLKFEKPLPKWLKGTLLRNGPGRFGVGERNFTNLLDGFAKGVSWNFPGDGSSYFSTKFLLSSCYNDSIKADDIATYLTIAPVNPPFTLEQKFKALWRNMDNLNVNVFNFTSDLVVLNDVWTLYTIDGRRLEVLERVDAQLPGTYLGFPYMSHISTAHPLPEAGTGDHITFIASIALLPGFRHKLTLVRVQSTKKREIIAQWHLKKISYMHSFSVSQNYALLIASPYYIDFNRMLRNMNIGKAMKWEKDEPSTIFVVHLKTGRVQSFDSETMFSMHHVNAFEIDKFRLAMDVIAYKKANSFSSISLSVLRNSTLRDAAALPSKLKRYIVNLKTGNVSVKVFRNSSIQPETAQIELPTINEKYRSKRYCFAYTVLYKADNKSYSNMAIMKKDLCHKGGASKDQSWSLRHHYVNEAWFVPREGGVAEDDGLLLFPMMDGVNQVSYLAVLDARTMTLVNKSKLPTNVPFTFHGRLFDI
ncbi:hypothetical protein FSP39_003143 [Pinctada imbricata]|uniref:Uncharacterized protein n=1 Tax=Pinctada imbricata TaxID=66713 RepID=A0AA88XH61_PINIB|nr:hypothetical protein FSP39_003143 [Pinctada imbricata]